MTFIMCLCTYCVCSTNHTATCQVTWKKDESNTQCNDVIYVQYVCKYFVTFEYNMGLELKTDIYIYIKRIDETIGVLYL